MITKYSLLIALLSALVAAPVQELSSVSSVVAPRTLINPAGVKNRGQVNALYGHLPFQFESNQGSNILD
jgi:hypothetical protein